MSMLTRIGFIRMSAVVGMLLLAVCQSSSVSPNDAANMAALVPLAPDAYQVEQLAAAESKYADTGNWIVFDAGKSGKEADIFVIYPSTSGSDPEDSPYFRIDSPDMRRQAKQWVSGLSGGSGYGGAVPGLITSHTNVYAPYYRQANIFGGGNPNMSGTPYDDVAEAFNYYYETVNKGRRPFIILGFSQGGYLAIELATRFLGAAANLHINDNHVVTYSPGWAVTQANIKRNSRISFSQSYNDIGVITSWNSIAPCEVEKASTGSYATIVNNGLVTNPITWKTDEREVPASENKRSYTGGSLRANYCGAQAVTRGNNNRAFLIILGREKDGDTPSSSMLGNHHGDDVPFFYESITDNIKDRIEAFKMGPTLGIKTAGRDIR